MFVSSGCLLIVQHTIEGTGKKGVDPVATPGKARLKRNLSEQGKIIRETQKLQLQSIDTT